MNFDSDEKLIKAAIEIINDLKAILMETRILT